MTILDFQSPFLAKLPRRYPSTEYSSTSSHRAYNIRSVRTTRIRSWYLVYGRSRRRGIRYAYVEYDIRGYDTIRSLAPPAAIRYTY